MRTTLNKVSRRGFLRQAAACAAAAAAAVAAGRLVSACAGRSIPKAESPAILVAATVEKPTTTVPPAQKATSTPTHAPTTEAAKEVRSKIVQAFHPGVWQGENLSDDALGQMLDRSITALTGLEDPGKAWAALFKPGERVAIKVNAIISGSSHVPLVMAVANRLQGVGIAAKDIVIYDRSDEELKNAGFALNRGGKGIRCRGNNGEFSAQAWKLLDSDVHLSQMLGDCDALINIPVLKGLTVGGLSFALKNHYGTVDNPSRFHNDRFSGGVTGLNALEPLRQKTRLIIGDVLARETHADWTSYAVVGGVNGLLMSADPVTVDLLGLLMCVEALGKKGINTTAVRAQSEVWLKAGATLGLGSDDIRQVDLKRIDLS